MPTGNIRKQRPGGSRSGSTGRRAGSKTRRRRQSAWRKFRRRHSEFFRAAYWSSVVALWLGVGCGIVLIFYIMGLPDTSNLWKTETPSAVTILDRHGVRLVSRGITYGTPLSVHELPAYLPQAVIATEDRRFYYHIGIDPLSLMRAALANLTEGRIVQGGSTITQQLAKNLFLTNERTLKRKIQEGLLALQLEWRFSKDQILTLYLNRVYLGAGTYGVEAAAQRYFGKSATQVTLAEAALLAGLLKAPSRYAPTNDLDRSRWRTDVVLKAMVDAGFIDDAQRRNAQATKPRFTWAAATPGVHYFIDWVVEQLPTLVSRPDTDLVVRTTLDLELQIKAEKAVALTLDRDGDKLNFSQAALVSLTPDGAVRALVGGRSYAVSQFNRAIQARRQPGSAFKPFVYLTALEQGMSPSSEILDAPITIGNWSPKNYNNDYRGKVTLTTALARSLNTAAVRLAEQVGHQNIVDTAYRLGIQSKLDPNTTLPLGTSEVALLELAAAYAPFANGGAAVIAHSIIRIETDDGVIIYERLGGGLGRAVTQRNVGYMNEMLSAAMRWGTGRAANLAPRAAAGKTGTSQDSRDAWFIGYTADLVTGVWVGNDDYSPMRRVTGGTVPAVIWKDYMLAASANDPMRPLPAIGAKYVSADGKNTGGNVLTRFLSRLIPGR